MVCRHSEDVSQSKHMAGKGPPTVLTYHWGRGVYHHGDNSLGQELEAVGLTTPQPESRVMDAVWKLGQVFK